MGGRYTVTVGRPPAALVASVAQTALDPPPPIAELQARAMAEAALAAAASSSNPSLRSTAQLVEGLANIVLGTSDPNS